MEHPALIVRLQRRDYYDGWESLDQQVHYTMFSNSDLSREKGNLTFYLESELSLGKIQLHGFLEEFVSCSI